MEELRDRSPEGFYVVIAPPRASASRVLRHYVVSVCKFIQDVAGEASITGWECGGVEKERTDLST